MHNQSPIHHESVDDGDPKVAELLGALVRCIPELDILDQSTTGLENLSDEDVQAFGVSTFVRRVAAFHVDDEIVRVVYEKEVDEDDVNEDYSVARYGEAEAQPDGSLERNFTIYTIAVSRNYQQGKPTFRAVSGTQMKTPIGWGVKDSNIDRELQPDCCRVEKDEAGLGIFVLAQFTQPEHIKSTEENCEDAVHLIEEIERDDFSQKLDQEELEEYRSL